MADDWEQTSAVCRNLFDPTDVVTELYTGRTGLGVILADALPPANAIGVKYVPETAVVASGGKRLVGVAEQQVVDGVVTLPATIGVLDSLMSAFVAPLLSAIVGVSAYSHVIVKRIPFTDPITLKIKYRLPANSIEAVVSPIVDSSWNLFVSSQVSRKISVAL